MLLTKTQVFREPREAGKIDDMIANFRSCINDSYPDEVKGLFIMCVCVFTKVGVSQQATWCLAELCCRWKII